jgi:hypothetical protein
MFLWPALSSVGPGPLGPSNGRLWGPLHHWGGDWRLGEIGGLQTSGTLGPTPPFAWSSEHTIDGSFAECRPFLIHAAFAPVILSSRLCATFSPFCTPVFLCAHTLRSLHFLLRNAPGTGASECLTLTHFTPLV